MLLIKKVKQSKNYFETHKGNTHYFEGPKVVTWYFLGIPVYKRIVTVRFKSGYPFDESI